jgi:hypothetical protein
MSVSWDLMQTTGVSGAFLKDTEGYIAGFMLDDPAIRYQIESGVLASGVSGSVYAGLPVTISIPEPGALLGSVLTLATSAANIDGWIVANQSADMFVTPSNPVPVAIAGMTVNFVRKGTGARIVLPISSGLASSLPTEETSTQVSWDFTNQELESGASNVVPCQIMAIDTHSKTVTLTDGQPTGWTTPGNVAVIKI